MKRKEFLKLSVLTTLTLGTLAIPSIGFSQQKRIGGPQLGQPAKGPILDKSQDAVLSEMIKKIVPQFKQLTFQDPKDSGSLKYSLFIPSYIEPKKKYPLVLFMADASTPGRSDTAALTQGYGALVWAEKSFQKQNPCFVLVPEYAGVTVNDAYERSPEVDRTIRLLEALIAELPIDTDRLYTTGQSMGGMMSMYFNIAYPDLFAATIFVDCHWDQTLYSQLLNQKFIYFAAGAQNRAGQNIATLEKLLNQANKAYSIAQWSARLPIQEQDKLAVELLSKDEPINFIIFEAGSVLPPSGIGSEHMYSFDFAYKIPAVRQWLFKQSKH